MARSRLTGDWEHDLATARLVEREVFELLSADRRITDLVDDTASFDQLDFRFRYRGQPVAVDVKEKRQRYSAGMRDLWPGVPEGDLFIVDETVFRRIVWQGGGGYLLVHDLPQSRWIVLGPWELTLGNRVRFGRWGRRGTTPFLKGKLLLDLSVSDRVSSSPSVDVILSAIDMARSWTKRVEPFPFHGATLREIGAPD